MDSTFDINSFIEHQSDVTETDMWAVYALPEIRWTDDLRRNRHKLNKV